MVQIQRMISEGQPRNVELRKGTYRKDSRALDEDHYTQSFQLFT